LKKEEEDSYLPPVNPQSILSSDTESYMLSSEQSFVFSDLPMKNCDIKSEKSKKKNAFKKGIESKGQLR